MARGPLGARRHPRQARPGADRSPAGRGQGGIALLTPEMLHYGLAGEVIQQRQQVLDDAFARHPERSVRTSPKHPPQPTAVWINPPSPNPSREDLRL